MKRLTLIILIAALIMLLCGSGHTYGIDGIENFQTTHSDFELNLYLLPSTDFIDRYEHTNIEYHYREDYESMFRFVERSLIVIDYDQETYLQAKEFCLEELELSESNTVAYNGYTFIENIKLAVGQNRYNDDSMAKFPKWFNMFAYNDSLNCLVFMGFYGSDYSSKDAQSVCDSWGTFVETNFSDIYDWSIEKAA